MLRAKDEGNAWRTDIASDGMQMRLFCLAGCKFCNPTHHYAYSPNWCPDITLIHGARDGSHVLADVTCPYVSKRAALPEACHMPLATAIATYTAAMKHTGYCNAHPIHTRCYPFG